MTDGWRLTVRERPPLRVEVGSLNPQALATLTVSEVERLPLPMGRRNIALAEIFKFEGQPGPRVTFHGSCERLDGIDRCLIVGRVAFHRFQHHDVQALGLLSHQIILLNRDVLLRHDAYRRLAGSFLSAIRLRTAIRQCKSSQTVSESIRKTRSANP